MKNPYAPPTAELHGARPGAPEDAEAVRRAHLHHEGALRGLGRIYQVFGALSLPWGPLMALGGVATAIRSDVSSSESAQLAAFFLAVFGAFMTAVAAVQIWAGTGMRAYRRRARVAAAALAALQLLNIPWGTALGAATLWALFAPEGERIFAADYPAIVEATPHLRPGTHPVVWVVLALFVGTFGLLVAGAVALMAIQTSP